MNQQIKQQWIDALLSGKYKQTTGVLRSKHGFCCLGVLCDIVDKEAWEDAGQGDGTYNYRGQREVLPDEIVYSVAIGNIGSVPNRNISIKMSKEDVEMYGLGEKPSLTELNDNGASFEDIAKVIEKYL